MKIELKGNSKIYRDLLVKVGDGPEEWAEDVTLPVLPEPQAAVVEAILSGQFTLTVAETGTVTVVVVCP